MIDAYIKNWLIKANHDLLSAQLLLEQEEIKNKDLTDTICFHCQQAVEKLLKAFLVIKNIKFSKTHNLFLLLEQCKSADAEFINIDIGNLNNYSIEIRYPDDFYIPSMDETRIAYTKALEIKEIIFKKLEIDLKDY